MTKRIKHKLGVCRRYDEDFWGDRLLFDKKVSRISKFLRKKYEERFDKIKLKRLKRLERITYENKVREEILEKYRTNAERKRIILKDKAFQRNKTTLQKIQEMNLMKMQPFDYKQTHVFIGKVKFFLYRIDIGKPMIKRIKRNKHFLILMARQKIRRFCSQFRLKTLRRYLKLLKFKNYSLSFFFLLLESRLDFILYRMNIIDNKPLSFRQIINHKVDDYFYDNKKVILANHNLLQIGAIFSIGKISRKIYYLWLQRRFVKGLIYMSIPSYFIINYRLMMLLFYKLPSIFDLFYPCKLAFLVKRLPSMSIRFFNN